LVRAKMRAKRIGSREGRGRIIKNRAESLKNGAGFLKNREQILFGDMDRLFEK